jgi:hypothetical protein
VSNVLHVVLVAVLVGIAAPATGTGTAPKISLAPASGPPGSIVTVNGRDFCRAPGCSGVDIQIYGVPVATAVPVSASGTFTRRVKIPGGPSGGELGVIAVQQLADESEARAFTSFRIVLHDPVSRTTPPPSQRGSAVPPTTPPNRTTPRTPPTATAGQPSSVTPLRTEIDARGASRPSPNDDGPSPWTWLAALTGIALLTTGAVLLVRRSVRRR